MARRGLKIGSGINFKPTQKQINGGLLGTLAAIGIPMAIELASKLFGSGLQVPRKAGNGLQVSAKPPGMMLYNPPPFFGTWEQKGMGQKKKSGTGLLLGPNSPFNSIPLLGTIL